MKVDLTPVAIKQEEPIQFFNGIDSIEMSYNDLCILKDIKMLYDKATENNKTVNLSYVIMQVRLIRRMYDYDNISLKFAKDIYEYLKSKNIL